MRWPIAGFVALSLGAATAPAAQGSDAQAYRFRLTRGAGTEVCDAYLKRLQATHFEHPPYCGRPENDSIAGFPLLHREMLSAARAFMLYNRVSGFIVYGDQYWTEHEAERWRARNSSFRPAQATVASVEASFKADFLRVWRYDPSIDIENDGTKDDLIVWFGDGVSPVVGSCGALPSNVDYPTRVGQLPFFVSPAMDAIDIDRTMKVFGAPSRDQPSKATGHMNKPHMIGSQISFFEFGGIYYFDTFLNESPDLEASGAKERRLADMLGVFVHKGGATREVCEYHVTQ